jgi:hypothetical protein
MPAPRFGGLAKLAPAFEPGASLGFSSRQRHREWQRIKVGSQFGVLRSFMVGLAGLPLAMPKCAARIERWLAMLAPAFEPCASQGFSSRQRHREWQRIKVGSQFGVLRSFMVGLAGLPLAMPRCAARIEGWLAKLAPAFEPDASQGFSSRQPLGKGGLREMKKPPVLVGGDFQ